MPDGMRLLTDVLSGMLAGTAVSRRSSLNIRTNRTGVWCCVGPDQFRLSPNLLHLTPLRRLLWQLNVSKPSKASHMHLRYINDKLSCFVAPFSQLSWVTSGHSFLSWGVAFGTSTLKPTQLLASIYAAQDLIPLNTICKQPFPQGGASNLDPIIKRVYTKLNVANLPTHFQIRPDTKPLLLDQSLTQPP
ncbi:hypothetical protein MVEN_01372700 [Mycena venus]|uniref:Uncharacterized protein n=1 Tax=Mycena venus TaxID=2733690 RepID=A0A8H7CUC9_9AGAR|nr:hypothetical protein MVEN_01372700 [Mycena venus]